MKKEINLKEVELAAESLYKRGGFSCSESVMSTIIDCFELQIPKEVIALTSGFSGGIGKSGCTCGALAGGVMALGIFFGRSEEGDPKVKKNHELTNELYQAFYTRTEKDAVCCRVLTKGFDMEVGEHKNHCSKYVGFIARKVAEIIIRENA